MTESCLTQALRYAERGWAVHPLHHVDDRGRCSCGRKECPGPGKHPRLGGWQRRATRDPGTLRGWWGRWARANVGVHCGASGLVGIDVDAKHAAGGPQAWEALCAALRREDGVDPEDTLIARTPTGGLHLYYLAPEGVAMGPSAWAAARVAQRAGSSAGAPRRSRSAR